MKRAIVAWIGLALLVSLMGIGYVSYQSSLEADAQNDQARQESEREHNKSLSKPVDKTATQPTGQPGVYQEYQEGLLSSHKGVKVLFFHAPWCPQCRMIEDDIKSQGVPDGVSILKVDYDSNQALRRKYEVTLQTTFVKVDDSGAEIEKFVAYNEPTFDSVKAHLLNE